MDITGVSWSKSSRSSGSNACVEVAIGVAENRSA